MSQLGKGAGIFLAFMVVIQESAGLKCFKCLALDCPEDKIFCNSVKTYIVQQLTEYYYSMDITIPICPKPIDAYEEWELLKAASSTCQEEKDGEATCTAGRFRVTTLIVDLKKNVTSYGTILGCAKRKLLETTKIALRLRNQCGLVENISPVRNSLRHILELEHCPLLNEMCHSEDFCVRPETSIVKPFKDVPDGISTPVGIFIGVAVLLGIMVAALTFAGIKFNS